MSDLDLSAEDKKALTARLGLCAAAALAVWYGADRAAHIHAPFGERYGPVLSENKTQIIAVIAALLFGLSLFLRPIPSLRAADPPAASQEGEDIFEDQDHRTAV